MGMYEFALSAALGVTVTYAVVEYPFMRTSGLWATLPWYFEMLGWGMHILP